MNTNADITSTLLLILSCTMSELIKIRVRSSFNALVDKEADLIIIKNSLDWLLSDLRESRQKIAGSPANKSTTSEDERIMLAWDGSEKPAQWPRKES